jgi:hypothetical protein
MTLSFLLRYFYLYDEGFKVKKQNQIEASPSMPLLYHL